MRGRATRTPLLSLITISIHIVAVLISTQARVRCKELEVNDIEVCSTILASLLALGGGQRRYIHGRSSSMLLAADVRLVALHHWRGGGKGCNGSRGLRILRHARREHGATSLVI
jgi:hypothetical protein